MITTKRPDDDMIEVAITSMQEALVADGNAVPAGSTPFERDPLQLPSKGDAPDDTDAPDPVAATATAAATPAAAPTAGTSPTDVGETPPLA
jgi:hypothetical protein